jgi:CubicO group peptidase (beta-lactamase class C family)
MVTAEVHGQTEDGWGAVANAFRKNFEEGREIGSACAVYADGELVVDLWGGVADRRTGRPWEDDSVVVVWSTTKGAVALCAHILAERGDLDLDAPVAEYWPEFAQNGKQDARVRWLLSHQVGLPYIDAELTLEEVCAWEPIVGALAAQKPLWTPGEHHAYHAFTYGYLVGEVVRRVTGKSIGTFLSDEIAGPLQLSTWIGLPEEVEPRVAPLESSAQAVDPVAALEALGLDHEAAVKVAEWQASSADPSSWQSRSGNLGGAFPPDRWLDIYNSRILRGSEHPGANMVSDARSIARMYAATVGEVDGVRLLTPETVEAMTVVQTSSTSPFGMPADIAALQEPMTTPISLGFMHPSNAAPMTGPRSFGHPGAGGSIGFADPDSRIGFGYVMNLMSSDGERLRSLVTAAGKCAGSGA